MSKINTDILIAAVKMRPELWQNQHKDFKNKRVTTKLWNEVGEYCNCTGLAAKLKWKNCKDSYRKNLRKLILSKTDPSPAPAVVKWPLFNMMSFIKDTITTDITLEELKGLDDFELATVENFPKLAKDDPDDETSCNNYSAPLTTTPCSQSDSLSSPSRFQKRSVCIENEFEDFEHEAALAFEDNTKPTEADADLLFFKSLLPFMEKFNEIEKLEVRGEIQNIILSKLRDKLQQ